MGRPKGLWCPCGNPTTSKSRGCDTCYAIEHPAPRPERITRPEVATDHLLLTSVQSFVRMHTYYARQTHASETYSVADILDTMEAPDGNF